MTKGLALDGSRSPLASLDTRRLAKALVLFLFFVVASGNARFIWWSGLLPTLALCPVVLLLARHPGGMAAIGPLPALAFLSLTALMIVGGASAALVDPDAATFLHWAGVYLSPVLLYAAVRSIEWDERLARWAWSLLLAGTLVPLVGGLAAYYSEWGVPTGLELLLSRYSLERMTGYMQATYGNTGNTAALLALLLPAWLAALLSPKPRPLARAVALVGLAVAMCHVLIVQSRTLFLVMLLVLPVILLFFRVRIAPAVIALLLIAGAVVLPALEARDRFVELTVGALDGEGEDQSVSERVEAMHIGLALMRDHPAFGVGPGHSTTANPYTTAHQYWVHQGAEIGIAGFLLSVLLSLAVFIRTAVAFLRGRTPGGDRWAFLHAVGPAGFMLYGVIANMTLAMSVVNTWVGLFAMLLAMADAPRRDAGRGRG